MAGQAHSVTSGGESRVLLYSNLACSSSHISRHRIILLRYALLSSDALSLENFFVHFESSIVYFVYINLAWRFRMDRVAKSEPALSRACRAVPNPYRPIGKFQAAGIVESGCIITVCALFCCLSILIQNIRLY